MYRIKIEVECPDARNEVLPDALEDLALLVEDRVSVLLVELFGSVTVNAVTLSFVDTDERKTRQRPAS
ncbi:MAG TPA: hypothetical protein VGN32_14480 [Ktedonobacterales bacterium]|jgi:NADH dehydrogenase FAD-containing subunit|nr:hypothetical protein [Ktedonobacterales bacterium]